MFHSWVAPLLPGSLRFHLDLAEHCAGRLAGPFTPVPAARSDALKPGPLRIHFWTPRPQFSAVIHVHRVVPPLREQASARGLPWQITSGDRLPETPVDWLICLKGIPPSKTCPMERTVLLIPDDADRVWGHLRRFGHLVSVTSHTLASFLAPCILAYGSWRKRNRPNGLTAGAARFTARFRQAVPRCCCGTGHIRVWTAFGRCGRCWRCLLAKLPWSWWS